VSRVSWSAELIPQHSACAFSTALFLPRIENAWTTAHEYEKRLGVPRQASARRRFRGPDGVLKTKIVLHPAKAVSPMQGCAVHLCHRTPRRWRAVAGSKTHARLV